MLSLTRQEQLLLIFILLSLVIGSVVKHYRHLHSPPSAKPAVLSTTEEVRAPPQNNQENDR